MSSTAAVDWSLIFPTTGKTQQTCNADPIRQIWPGPQVSELSGYLREAAPNDISCGYYTTLDPVIQRTGRLSSRGFANLRLSGAPRKGNHHAILRRSDCGFHHINK